jgi:hypothetical protein
MGVRSSEACLEKIAGLRVFRVQGAGYQAYLDISEHCYPVNSLSHRERVGERG